MIELNGSANQDIDAAAGSILNTIDFRLNNAAGATLLTALVLPYRYTINSGNLTLGSNTLTTPVINQEGIPSLTANHIVTNGSGGLKISAIGAGPINFPIGPSASSYNPVIISSGSGADYTARVEIGINPAIAFPAYGINRTWSIHASVVTPGVGVVFQYASADANVNAIQPQNMEILLNSGTVWNIIPGNTNITPVGADPAWTITSATPISIAASVTPYALGVGGGFTLPLDCIISCRSKKINSNGIISWEINSCSRVINFEVQRSINGENFHTLSTIVPGAELVYSYTDADLANGTNLYRVKVNRGNSGMLYSNTVVVMNDPRGVLITALSPNPVRDKATLNVIGGRPGIVSFVIQDIIGKTVKCWQAFIAAGSNSISLYVNELPPGIYHLVAFTNDAKTITRFVKQ